MRSELQYAWIRFGVWSSATGTALALAIILVAGTAAQPARAESYRVLHAFKGGTDGANPYAAWWRVAKAICTARLNMAAAKVEMRATKLAAGPYLR